MPNDEVVPFPGQLSLTADCSGGGTSSASFGGVCGTIPPITAPATIKVSPGPTIFTGGPTTILTGTDANSQVGLFSANIGDTLTIDVATSAVNALDGTGSANARAAARLSVNVGTCIGHGAPAVSHAGLAALAVVLGALGFLTIARRRSLRLRAEE